MEFRDIGEWEDNNPLNFSTTRQAELNRLFNKSCITSPCVLEWTVAALYVRSQQFLDGMYIIVPCTDNTWSAGFTHPGDMGVFNSSDEAKAECSKHNLARFNERCAKEA